MTTKSDDRSSLVDPRVADAWRGASSEEPAASVDDAILAAARREVSARPETLSAWEAREARASRRRWWPLAAAATVAVIAVGVLQLTPTDKIVHPATETATVSDTPAPAMKPDAGAATPPPATPAASIALPGSASTAVLDRSARATTDTAHPTPQSAPPSSPRASPPAAAPAPPSAPAAAPAELRQQGAPSPTPTPDPFPAAKQSASDAAAASGQVAAPTPASPAPSRREAAANAARESDSVARQAAPPLARVAGASPAESGTAEGLAKDRRPIPVADWVALIRRLRAEGNTDEAAKELAAFRAAHPDHDKLLPPDLRDWRPQQK